MLKTEIEVRKIFGCITKELISRKITISTMESMTGGLLSSLITDTEGASAVLNGSFVTYSNEAKISQGVPEEVIATYGVYSIQTAEAMAAASVRGYNADVGVGVTGTAGNRDENNSDSIPGNVFYAVCYAGKYVSGHIKINPEDMETGTRYEYKLYAAREIGMKIMNLVFGESMPVEKVDLQCIGNSVKYELDSRC